MDTLYIVMAGVGALFALGALSLVWAYLIDTLRGVNMPDYQNIRVLVNVLFALSLGIFSFLAYHNCTWESLYMRFFLVHGITWVFTFLVGLVSVIFHPETEGLGSAVLTAMWKIFIILLVLFALPF